MSATGYLHPLHGRLARKAVCSLIALSMLAPGLGSAQSAEGGEAAGGWMYRIPIDLKLRQGAGSLELRPLEVDFGAVAVSQSRLVEAELVNTGAEPVSAIAARAPSPFAADSTNCGILAPGQGCKVLLTYSPTRLGAAMADLDVTASTEPVKGKLLGYGVNLLTDIEVSSDLWYFGSWALGKTSDTRQLVLHNKGSKAFSFSQLSLISGASDYELESQCGASLGPDAYCTVKATFTPSENGLRLGAFRIRGEDGSLRDVNMVGYGGNFGNTGGHLSLASALNFGNVQVGTVPDAQTLKLTNQGVEPVTVEKPVLAGADAAAFDVKSTCPPELQPWQSCDLTVTAPALSEETRPYEAVIRVATSEPGAPKSVSVFATVTKPTLAHLEPDPSVLRMEATAVGDTTKATVHLKNKGPNPASVTEVTTSNPGLFTATSKCGSELAVGGTCDIEVTYTAASADSAFGNLSVNSTAGEVTVGLQGVVPAPKLSAGPTPVTFAAGAIGTTSDAQRVTLTNAGSAPLTITSITATDSTLATQATNFAASNSCGKTLAPYDRCFVDVVFRPDSEGDASGALLITSNDPKSPAMPVWLSGTGIKAVTQLTVSPNPVYFGQVPMSKSLLLSLQVTNTGTVPSQLLGVVVPEDAKDAFSQTNTCEAPLKPKERCALNVQFTPAALGPRSATLSLALADGSAVEVPVSGEGTDGTGKAELEVTPGALAMGTVLLGRTSGSKLVTLRNTGDAPLHISSLGVLTGDGSAVSTEFAVSNSCGEALPSDGQCTVAVDFQPHATGGRSAHLVIESDDPASAVKLVPLQGTGLQGELSVEPSWGVTFADTAIGASDTRTFKVVNQSTTPAQVTAVGLRSQASAFRTNNGCSEVLGQGSVCAIKVQFAPTVEGPAADQLVVLTADGSVFELQVSGVGIPADEEHQPEPSPAGVAVSPSPVDFGIVKLKTSSSQPVTVKNFAESSTMLTSVEVTSASDVFAAGQSCQGALDSGASCTFIVTAKPTAVGPIGGSIALKFADGSSLTLPLKALGSETTTVPRIEVSPANLDFGLVDPASPVTKPVAVRNTGEAPAYLQVPTVTPSGTGIVLTSHCASPLAVGAECDIDVRFEGSTRGAVKATLLVTPTGGEAVSVPLTGAGTQPKVAVAPTTLTFGSVGTLMTSAAQVIHVSNVGTSSMRVYPPSTPAGFESTNLCPSSLPTGGICDIEVRFAPESGKAYDVPLLVRTDDSATPAYAVRLIGTGLGATLQATPTSLTFGQQPLGGFEDQTVRIENTGGGGTPLATISAGQGKGFTAAPHCPGLLMSGDACDVSVRFSPTGAGVHFDTLRVSSGGENPVAASVSLTGEGPPASFALLGDTLDFGTQAVGVESLPLSLIVQNTGTVAASVYGAQLADKSAFTTKGCQERLEPGATCAIELTFKPSKTGAFSETVVVQSASSTGPMSATLKGTGAAPTASLSVGSLDFGTMYAGKTRTMSAILSNTSQYPLVVTGVSAGAQFEGATDCKTALQPGATCEVSVIAKPTRAGLQTETLSVQTNASNALSLVARVQVEQTTLTAITPDKLPVAGGVQVLMRGTGFGAKPQVSFDETPATSVQAVSSTEMLVVVPAHAAGYATVTVTEGDAPPATLSKGVTYLAKPALTSALPTTGPALGGWTSTLSGTGLSCDSTVLVDGKAASISGCTAPNSLTISVPTRSVNKSGAVNVVVRNGGGEATLVNALQYVEDSGRLTFQDDMGAFGNILKGTTTTRSMALKNAGTLPAQITSYSVQSSPASAFTLASGGTCPTALPASLAPGQSCLLQIKVTGESGTATGKILVNGGAAAGGIEALLSAAFEYPTFVFSSKVNSLDAPDAAFAPVAYLASIGLPNSPTSQPMYIFFNNIGLVAGAKLQNATLTLTGPSAAKFRVVQSVIVANNGTSGGAAGAIASNGLSVTGISTNDGVGTYPHLRLYLNYTPTTEGVDVAQLRLDYGDGNFALLPLVGSATYDVAASLSATGPSQTPPVGDFGSVEYSPAAATTKSITYYVRNSATVPEAVLKVSRMSVAGPDASAFTFASCAGSLPSPQDCRPTSMVQGTAAGALTFGVNFKPTRVGSYNATLIVEHSGTNDGGTLVLPLTALAARDVQLTPSGGAGLAEFKPAAYPDGSTVRTSWGTTYKAFLRHTGTAGRVKYTGIQITGSTAFSLAETGLARRDSTDSTQNGTAYSNLRSTALALVGDAPGGNSDLFMKLSFAPKTQGTHTATVTVFHDGPGGQSTFDVSGDAVNVHDVFLKGEGQDASRPNDFSSSDPTASAGRQFTIKMTQPADGYAMAKLYSIQLSGRDADQFKLASVYLMNASGRVTSTLFNSTAGATSAVLNSQLNAGDQGRVTLMHKPTRSGLHEVTVTVTHNGTKEATSLTVTATRNDYADFRPITPGVASAYTTENGFLANLYGNSVSTMSTQVGFAPGVAIGKWYVEFELVNMHKTTVGNFFIDFRLNNQAAYLVRLTPGGTNRPSIYTQNVGTVTGVNGTFTAAPAPQEHDRYGVALDRDAGTFRWFHYVSSTGQCTELGSTSVGYTGSFTIVASANSTNVQQIVRLTNGAVGNYGCPIPAGYSPLPNMKSAATG